MALTPRRGARLNWLGDDMIYVAQTVKRGTAQNAPYRIERREDGRAKETFVNHDDEMPLMDGYEAALGRTGGAPSFQTE